MHLLNVKSEGYPYQSPILQTYSVNEDVNVNEDSGAVSSK